MKQWHYVLSGEQKGPIPEDQLVALLASGELARDTLVWAPDMENWTPAGDVQALSPRPGMPPELPSATEPPAPKPESKALSVLASIAAAAIGFFAVRLLPFDMTIRFMAGAFAGCLCGLIPYFIAKNRSNLKLAKLALGICTLSGLLLGLILAVPVCVGFVIVALVTKRGE
jgi:hypothetical protein